MLVFLGKIAFLLYAGQQKLAVLQTYFLHIIVKWIVGYGLAYWLGNYEVDCII